MPIAIDHSPIAAHEQQIVQTLRLLPPEKVAEVWDFVSFLQDRYARAPGVDVEDSWSEQDVLDLTRASLAYAEDSLPREGHDDAQAR
jgi:hypothetical protein